jgi:hypothetical protein
VEKNSKTISHFCGLLGWLLSQLRFDKFFKKKKKLFYIDWIFGKFGGKKNKGKRKREPGQRVECTLFYFIFNFLISKNLAISS